ncbi:MAG: UDP-N-acetylglucosamine diphosphorylase/glucosamine-1-phosphate N-acetyltransferase GlmU [Microgenomates group bacterium Gr01-1014_7]|nr:MAG: UDP-N-acetylglucosamine diphosphorylase/glucosamine-1-phosphate N-acetyltransferase GlmU [Microgenomates group bacterium Gr01-1014_7]
MKIIVLAAGSGKRMWPIQKDKCLIPFLGKPLLYHNLKKIKGVLNPEEFIIVARPESKDKILEVIKQLGITGTIAIQQESKGMADAILSARELVEGEVLVINAEDIVDPDLYAQVAKGEEEVVLAGLKVDKYFPGGYIKVTGNRVQEIVEKPGEGNEPSDLVKLVVDYFKNGKKLIEYLQKASSDKDDRYEVALANMISDGVDIRVIKYNGIWIPLKYPWQILDILGYFLDNIEQRISPGAKIAKTAEISGKVIIEDGVRIFEGAVIKGPCYIGKNCIIGNNTMVRESALEEGCVTGFNSDITRSYIGAESWFHTNYIGDCVIEGDFGMGSGAVLANLRLDDHTIRVKIEGELIDSDRHKLGLIAGKGSRVGVNASTMPGVKIGANSLVGPGVTLYEDVKDNTKILVKQEYSVSEHTPALTSYDQFREKLN